MKTPSGQLTFKLSPRVSVTVATDRRRVSLHLYAIHCIFCTVRCTSALWLFSASNDTVSINKGSSIAIGTIIINCTSFNMHT